MTTTPSPSSSTTSTGRLPDFLVIGAMKSGSTSLHDHLAKHPALASPEHKEPGFFSRDERFARGLDWYRDLFADARADQLCFESSTCYSRWPHFGEVAPRIHKHLPDAKLIYIMRHPVDRAYSHYRHAMLERDHKGEGPIVSFEAMLAESEEAFDTGCYLRQIEQFLAHYDRDRLFLLTLEELKSNTDAVLERVQRFLELEVDKNLAAKAEGPSNKAQARAVQSTTKRASAQLSGLLPVRVLRALVPAPVRAEIRQFIVNSPPMQARVKRKADAFARQLSPLTAATRSKLLERYVEPNGALEAFWERPLPDSWAS